MSLADSIYEANDQEQAPKESLLDFLVDSAIAVSDLYRPSPYSIYQLHLEEDQIYLGHRLLEECPANVYRLTGYESTIPTPVLILFWKKLKSRLPVLDKNIIQITNNLYWDREKGEIVKYDEISRRFTNNQSASDEVDSEDV